jgi:hypothetical protein
MKRIAIILAALLATFTLQGCGGGDIISASHAQSITQTVHHLHGIVRPDANGNWFIQNDVDHAAIGIVGVTQTSEYLEIALDRRYTHAGTVQVTPDDDFNGHITVGSNLGVSSFRIRIKVNGQQIDPKDIYSYVPGKGSGNLWMNVTMVERSIK